MSSQVGTLLGGRYRLEQQIGAGGMSTVYVAFDTTLERRVAIKVMHRDIAAVRDLLPEIQTPVQIIAGRRDSLVPPANAEYLHEQLRSSRLALLDTDHFAWEDGAEQWGAIALDWIQANSRERAR